MTNTSETKNDRAAELKEKLALLKSEGGGGNGQTASSVPSNGKNTEPAKKRGAAVAKTPVKVPAKVPAKTPVKVEAKSTKKEPAKKESVKKEPAKRAAKATVVDKSSKTKKAKATDDVVHRSMDRDKTSDGLRPVERDIIKIVKGKRGKPISLRDIAVSMFGEEKVTEADSSDSKDNEIVRVIRNGIRHPCAHGLLKRWIDTDDKNAKKGYVLLGDVALPQPPTGAATRAKKVAKEKVEESHGKGKKAAKAKAEKASK